jgi:serine/threonine-protein kinase
MMAAAAHGPLPQLGRYRLIARLGEGGMAQVFLAVVRGPADVTKLFVIKQLRPELAFDEEFRAMFLDEVRLATKLSHPNVVQTYEFAEHEGRPLIAMEYLDGQPLHALLSRVGRQTFPLQLHLHVLAETLAGLHYAHALCDFDGTPLGIVHRDVSPQNVFVTYDGQVKLMDFGIAKATGSAAVTRAGVVKGKAGYIAPEQVSLEEVDRRADIFSVGVMLWEALAGRRLTLGLADPVVLYKRASGGWPSVDELGPGVPAALAEICSRAVATSPDDRYQSAKSFRDDLLGYLASVGAAAPAEALGALASGHFLEDRARVRSLLEVELRSANKSGEVRSASLLPMWPGAPPEASVPSHVVPFEGMPRAAEASAPSHAYVTGGAVAGTVAAPGLPARPALGRGQIAALAGGALLSVALGAFVIVRVVSPQGEPAARRGGDEPGAAPHVAAPLTASAAPAPPPAPDAVQLTIATRPAEAKVFLDGKLLGQNPFRGAVPHDPSLHQVTVAAPGCEKQERLVSFADDVALSFALRCRDGGRDGGRDNAKGRPGGSPPASAKADATSAPPGDGKEPGKPKPKLQVDEGDPYAR